MNKTIVIDPFDTKSLDAAIAEINRYKTQVKQKQAKFLSLLRTRSKMLLQIYWGDTLYDGIDDVKISAHKTETGFELVAAGKSVAFIEFGAGIYHQSFGATYPGKMPEGVAIGSFGRHQGLNNYWFYTGQPGNAGGELAHGHKNTTITHGNPPNAPMYRTAEEMRNLILETARDVFK